MLPQSPNESGLAFSSMKSDTPPTRNPNAHLTRSSSWRRSDLFISLTTALFLVILITVMNRSLTIDVQGDDAAYFDYTYGLKVDGHVPYRDFFVVQGPIMYWLHACFGRVLGGEIGKVTLGFTVYLFLVWSVTHLSLCASRSVIRENQSSLEPIGKRWCIAGLTAVIAGGSNLVCWSIIFGNRPKFLATAFLVSGVIALSKRRAVFAAMFATLACWTWHAVSIQIVGTLLVWILFASRTSAYHHLWREFLRGLISAIGVSLLFILILARQHALADFINQIIIFPLRYQIHTLDARGLQILGSDTLTHLLSPPLLLIKFLPPFFLFIVGLTLLIFVFRTASIFLLRRSPPNTTSQSESDVPHQ